MIQGEFQASQKSLLVSVWRGVLVGLSAGAIVSAFRWLIAKLFIVFVHLYHLAQKEVVYLVLLIAVSTFLIFFVGLLVKQEKDIKGSGIPHVEGELMGLMHPRWWSVLWRKFLGGILSISMGLMLGREGPSIQLGAMTAKGVAQGLQLTKREQRILIASGAAAGLSAAFNAPIAGLLFVVEEVYHHFSRQVWITALVASLVANAVSLGVFGQTPVLHMPHNLPVFPLTSYWVLLVMGGVMGLLAYSYEWVVLRIGKCFEVVGGFLHLPPHQYGLLTVLVMIPLGLTFPTLLGGGNEIIVNLPNSPLLLKAALLYFVLRFIGSMLSYGSGLPGGIFLPLLTLGALSGYTFGLAMIQLSIVDSSLVILFLILGMAGYFGAVSKAPLTAMILVTEMVGNLQQLMPLAVVTVVAYLVMDLLGGEPVYEAMLTKMIAVHPMESGEPTMIDLPVSDKLAGKMVKDLNLPRDVLISTQIYQKKTEVVTGATVLKAGAQIYLVVNESDISQVRHYLLE